MQRDETGMCSNARYNPKKCAAGREGMEGGEGDCVALLPWQRPHFTSTPPPHTYKHTRNM